MNATQLPTPSQLHHHSSRTDVDHRRIPQPRTFSGTVMHVPAHHQPRRQPQDRLPHRRFHPSDVVLGGDRWVCTVDGMTTNVLNDLTGEITNGTVQDLAMFTRLGWVETTGRGHYHILDRESLEQRAEQ